MQKAHKNSNQRSLVKLSWRLGLALMLALYTGVVAGAQSGLGDRFSCNLGTSWGGNSTTWISCGSSAGNFLYVCDRYGCDDSEGETNQYIADQRCEEIRQEGECPEPVN